MKPLRAAVVGVGALGQHHARIYADLEQATLVGVADVRGERAREIAGRHGGEPVEDYRSLIGRIDVASVAVPTVLHERVAADLLEGGVDVLVEKPITESLEAAERIIARARARGRVLMVGHTERFNPAFDVLAARARNVRFVEAHRLGSFSARSIDIDVVLDLMIHDLDVVLTLAGGDVLSVDAMGVGALTDTVDIANARVRFRSGCVANLTASRISAQKIRKLRVWEPTGYFSLDFAGRQVEHWTLGPEEGGRPTIISSRLEVAPGEPLAREIAEFLAAARERREPAVSGEDGRRALALGLLVLESIRTGQPLHA